MSLKQGHCGHSLPDHPRPGANFRVDGSLIARRPDSTAVPGAAGLRATAGQLPKFSRHYGVTPGHRRLLGAAPTARCPACTKADIRQVVHITERPHPALGPLAAATVRDPPIWAAAQSALGRLANVRIWVICASGDRAFGSA